MKCLQLLWWSQQIKWRFFEEIEIQRKREDEASRKPYCEATTSHRPFTDTKQSKSNKSLDLGWDQVEKALCLFIHACCWLKGLRTGSKWIKLKNEAGLCLVFECDVLKVTLCGLQVPQTGQKRASKWAFSLLMPTHALSWHFFPMLCCCDWQPEAAALSKVLKRDLLLIWFESQLQTASAV